MGISSKRCVAVLAMVAASVSQAETWNFSYKGFYDAGPTTWRPDYILSGSFTGNDIDSDGIISRGELTSFTIGGSTLLGNPTCPNLGVGLDCRLDSFSYHLTGSLAFDGTQSYSDDVFANYNHWVAGYRVQYSHSSPGANSSQTLYWTDDTVFTISPPPVPEPSIMAMASAGALLLAGSRLRQRRRNRV